MRYKINRHCCNCFSQWQIWQEIHELSLILDIPLTVFSLKGCKVGTRSLLDLGVFWVYGGEVHGEHDDV